MTSLGPVLHRQPSAAEGSKAQLGGKLSIPEARSLPNARMADPTPSPTSTSGAVADVATVVELKGIVGRLCSENRWETVLKIKGAVDSSVSAFVDGFDTVASQPVQLSLAEQPSYMSRSANF